MDWKRINSLLFEKQNTNLFAYILILSFVVLIFFGLMAAFNGSFLGQQQENNRVVQFPPQISGEDVVSYKCPNDYSSADEYFASIAQFINDYKNLHSDATTEDIFAARKALMLELGCKTPEDDLTSDSLVPILN